MNVSVPVPPMVRINGLPSCDTDYLLIMKLVFTRTRPAPMAESSKVLHSITRCLSMFRVPPDSRHMGKVAVT